MKSKQNGAALFVSLMMLVILTLLGISAVNMSTINFRITGNRQASLENATRTQNAIEAVLSDINYFTTPANTQNINGVAIAERRCYNRQTAPGYSLTWGLAPQDTRWEVVGSYTDPITDATTTIHQAVQIRMTSGNCD